MLSRSPRGSAAFTLLELVVVLVVLAVLATIAVPTFSAVVDRSHDSAATTSLASYARSVQAHAALRGGSPMEPSDFEETAPDYTMSAGPGVSAAMSVSVLPAPINAARFEVEQVAVISYALAEDGRSAGLAAISASGRCVGVHMTSMQVAPVSVPADSGTCNGLTVLRTAVGAVDPAVPGDAADPSNLGELGVPSVYRAAVDTSSVTLAWDPVANATGYTVQLAPTESMADSTRVEVGQSRRHTIPLDPGVTRYATVTALQGSKVSTPSKVFAVTALPAAPKNVRTSVSGSTVTVSWDAVPGAASYNVYRDGASTIAATTSGSTSVQFTLPAGSSASFVVRAANAGGLSAASSSTAVTLVPAAPQDVSATVSGTTATVSWAPVEHADGYYVYQDGRSDVVAATKVGNASTSASFPLADGQTATFAVRAYNSSGAGPASASVSATVVPASPQDVTVTVTGTQVVMRWTAVPGATSYDVSRDGSAPTSLTVTYATFTVAEGASATLTVAARNSSGVSPNVTRTVTVPPAAPTGVTTTVSGNTVTVTWNPSSGANGYYVYRDGASTIAATAVGNGTTSQTFTLADGSTASFVVRAYNNGGTSAASGSVSASAVPAAPTGVTATVSGTTATVSWNPSSGANGYYVYQDGSSTVTATAVGNGTTSQTFTLSEGQSASFVVRAYNDGGTSAASASATATVVPATPSGLAVSVSGTTATLTWTAVSGATSYDVYRDGATTPTVSVTGTSQTFTLAQGSSSTFQVRSKNGSGTSAASNTVTATAVPAAPTGVTTTVSGNTVTVSWNPSSGANGYYVYRDGASTIAATVVGATSQTFTLADGSTASFVVRAYNNGGTSAASASVSATLVPAAPTGVTATVSGNVATVSWNAVSGADGYYVYQDGRSDVVAATKVGNASTSASFPVADGQVTSFAVRAYNASGAGAASASVQTGLVPAAPTNLKATVDGGLATLTWTASSGATSYDVVRQDGSRTTVTATTAQLALVAGSTDTFRVFARNSLGASAQAASVTATAAPSAPQNVTASVSGNTVTVSWDASPGANGYYVYRDGSATIAATVVGATSTTFTVPDGSSASFAVRAYNNGGTSAASNAAGVTLVPAAPTGVSATVSGSTATVSWSAVQGADGYYVYQDGRTDVVAATKVGNASTSASFPLSSGQTSTFAVRAYNASGAGAASTSVSATVVPATPTGVQVSVSGTTATVSWSASSGATSYDVYRDGGATPVNVTGTSAQFTLTQGSSATFTVAARNSSGASPVSASVRATAAPAAPTGVTTSVSGDTVTVSWNAVSGANGYYVYRDGASTIAATVIGGSTTSTTFTIAAGTSTTFVVRAYNDGGTSAASSSVSAAGVPATAATPTASEITTAGMKLSWPAASGATGYLVQYRKTGAASWTLQTATTTSLTLTGLSWRTEYEFRVAGTNSSGTGAYSPSGSATTLTPPPVDHNSVYYDSAAAGWVAPVRNTNSALSLAADSSAQGLWSNLSGYPGRVYFRKVFTVAASGTYTLYWAADDAGVVKVDGTTRADGSSFTLSAGSHVVTAEASNLAMTPVLADWQNPGSFVASLKSSSGAVVVRTDTTWEAKRGPIVHWSHPNFMTREVTPYADGQRWGTPVSYGTYNSNRWWGTLSWWTTGWGDPAAELIGTPYDRDANLYTQGDAWTEFYTMLPSSAAGGQTKVWCDDSCRVFVNGAEVPLVRMGSETQWTATLPDTAVAGARLGVAAYNGGTSNNPSAIIVSVHNAAGPVIRNSDTTNWKVNRPNRYDPTSGLMMHSYDDVYVPPTTSPLPN